MSCREIENRLADDAQAATSDPAVAAHLAACPACKALAERLGRVDEALAGLAAQKPPAPPGWVIERTLERVDAAPLRPRRSRRTLWAALTAGATTVTLLLVAGLTTMGDNVRMLFSESANALAGNELATRQDVPERLATVELGRGQAHPPQDEDRDGVLDGPGDAVHGEIGGMAGKMQIDATKQSGESDKRDELSELDRRLGRYEQTRTRLALLEADEHPAENKEGQKARLRIENRPTSARVTIDGKLVPAEESTVALEQGVHRLRLELAGRAPVERDVELRNGTATVLDLAPSTPAAGDPERGFGLFAWEDTPLDELTYLPAQGYFKNTYLPGDPELAWLREGLEAGLWLDGRRTRLDTLARPYRQPFDPPERGGLALSLAADRPGVDGPTRLLLQVGLKGADRPAARRSALEAVLVVDLRSIPDEEARRALWSLAEALAEARQAGDRFSLVVAGGPAPIALPPEAFGPAKAQKTLADALLAIEARGANGTLGPALEQAYAALARPGAEDAPLGSQLVLLATASELGEEREALELRAHQAARRGVSLSTLGVGASAPADELAGLALAGQGRRRLLANSAAARPALEAELHAGGSVVARAIRLRIRLAPGVRLVGMLGSAPLEAPAADRVREAEQAIDQKVARDLGVAADRGEDEDGIQVVSPAFYAGDEHVLLLDVVAPGPGPLAEVRVRAKDLVTLENAVLTRRLDLDSGERPLDRRCLSVRKNALAFRLAEALSAAGERLADGDTEGARTQLRQAQARAARFTTEHPSLARDAEIARDAELLAAYGRALDAREQSDGEAAERERLARSLLAAGKSKLAFARPR